MHKCSSHTRSAKCLLEQMASGISIPQQKHVWSQLCQRQATAVRHPLLNLTHSLYSQQTCRVSLRTRCLIANPVSRCEHMVGAVKIISLASAQGLGHMLSCQHCQKHTRCHETATTYSSILLQVESTAASSIWGKAHSSSIARGHSAWNRTQVSQCDYCNARKERRMQACLI